MNTLPILDDLERALMSVDAHLAGLTWLDGVRLIYRKLQLILENAGVSAIEVEGQQFDPRYHEAVMHADGPEGKVLAEVQRGYKLHDRVLRPAMVVVGKGEGTGEAEEGVRRRRTAPAESGEKEEEGERGAVREIDVPMSLIIRSETVSIGSVAQTGLAQKVVRPSLTATSEGRELSATGRPFALRRRYFPLILRPSKDERSDNLRDGRWWARERPGKKEAFRRDQLLGLRQG